MKLMTKIRKKIIPTAIGSIFALPVVFAQEDAVFFLVAFDTLILLVIVVFIFFGVKKMLEKIK